MKRTMMVSPKQWPLILVIASCFLFQPSSCYLFKPARSLVENQGLELIEWLRYNNGTVSDKLQLRLAPHGRMALFASTKITEKEVLFSIPRACILTSTYRYEVGDRVQANYQDEGKWFEATISALMPTDNDDDDEEQKYAVIYDDGDQEYNVSSDKLQGYADGPMNCGTVKSYLQETKAKISPYAPYIEYLKAQPHSQLPSAWSKEGQRLLFAVLGKTRNNPQLLPPRDLVDWSYAKSCVEKKNAETEDAGMLLLQRGWDGLFVPLMDLLTHRNGEWINTLGNSVHGDKNVIVRASRDIQKGEQIYTSYNLCKDCKGRSHQYGTPEFFRDYGLVEDYPQRWIFGDNALKFELDYRSSYLEVRWLDGFEPMQRDITYMRHQLERLENIDPEEIDVEIPLHEWAAIWQYHEALVRALGHAFATATGAPACQDGFCAKQRYDSLQERKPVEKDISCSDTTKMEDYSLLSTDQSTNQVIEFRQEPNSHDTCLFLDSVKQICSSYRPHVYETMVHYAARFLPQIRRVAFVGGGNSMLLHELLKYPVEKVVGLELDQYLTRKSFQHFGTQPHWDNPKVEWWFGDPTKSLQMLPTEYYGSFDLVLVEGATSNSACDGAATLVQPKGILVTNKASFNELASAFKFALQIHLDGLPHVGSLVMKLASHEVDFMQQMPQDQSVPNSSNAMPTANSKSDFALVHDFRRNDTAIPKHCGPKDPSWKPETTTDAGILMIVEAEQINGPLEPRSKLVDQLTLALNEVRVSVVSVVLPEEQKDVMVVILKEGYVVARPFPNDSYCAFDIHLWRKRSLHARIKKALLDAISATTESSSQYRIVTGGMLATNAEEIKKDVGAPVTQSCPKDIAKSCPNRMKERTAHTVIEELLLSFAQSSNGDAHSLVLCGEEVEECASTTTLRNSLKADKLKTLKPCPGLPMSSLLSDEDVAKVEVCEKSLVEELRNCVRTDGQFDVVLVDQSASSTLAKILLRIVSDEQGIQKFFSQEIIMIIPTLDSETWRRNFLERIQHDVIVTDESVFRADVLFTSSDSSMELGILLPGDSELVAKFKRATNKLKERNDLTCIFQNLDGGNFPAVEPSLSLCSQHYDGHASMKQWQSQRPIGLQAIFQLGMKNERDRLAVSDKVVADYEEEGTKYPGVIVGVNRDDTYNIQYDDGDYEPDVKRRSIELIGTKVRKFESSLSCDEVQSALESSFNFIAHSGMSDATLTVFEDVGKGCVIVASWAGGHAVAVWDGLAHVDLNLYLPTENVDVANRLAKSVSEDLSRTGITVADIQPRGTDHVVSFLADIVSNPRPQWASR